jgi:hypothetical protein
MEYHEVTDDEWKKLSLRQRIKVLKGTGISYREAWELSDISETLSDLPGELLPLEVKRLPPEDMKTIHVTLTIKDFEELKKAKGIMSWREFIVKMGRESGDGL